MRLHSGRPQSSQPQPAIFPLVTLLTPGAGDPRVVANRIAVGALVVALVSALFTGLTFLTPLTQVQSSQYYHANEFLKGISAESRTDVLRALSHTKAGSPAEALLLNLRDAWRAAFNASKIRSEAKFKVSGGSVAGHWGGYDACFAKIAVLPTGCWTLTDFIHDPATGLVVRFSVEGIPIEQISMRSSTTEDSLGGEVGLLVKARLQGRINNPNTSKGDRTCVTYLLDAEFEEKNRNHVFNRKKWVINDRLLEKAKGDVAWPSVLYYYAESMAAVCVESSGGFIQVKEVQSKKQRGKKRPTAKWGWLWL